MRGEDVSCDGLFGYVDLEASIPAGYPLRTIRDSGGRGAVGVCLAEFALLYSKNGRALIAPEKLLRELLLQAFYTNPFGAPAERASWTTQPVVPLVRRSADGRTGVGCDDPFEEPRPGWLRAMWRRASYQAVRRGAPVRRLLSDEHFSVDGTLIEAWASIKSFRRSDGARPRRARHGGPGEGWKNQGSIGPCRVSQASRREEIRLAWAHAVPWSLRGRMEFPLATWAVLGMLIARAQFSPIPNGGPSSASRNSSAGSGGAGRKTVAVAVARLEKAGLVHAIRCRRNPALQRGQRLRFRAPGGHEGRLGDALAGRRGAGDAGEAVERPAWPCSEPLRPSRRHRGPRRARGNAPLPFLQALRRTGRGLRGRQRISPPRRAEDSPAPGEGPRAAPGVPKLSGS